MINQRPGAVICEYNRRNFEGKWSIEKVSVTLWSYQQQLRTVADKMGSKNSESHAGSVIYTFKKFQHPTFRTERILAFLTKIYDSHCHSNHTGKVLITGIAFELESVVWAKVKKLLVGKWGQKIIELILFKEIDVIYNRIVIFLELWIFWKHQRISSRIRGHDWNVGCIAQTTINSFGYKRSGKLFDRVLKPGIKSIVFSCTTSEWGWRLFDVYKMIWSQGRQPQFGITINKHNIGWIDTNNTFAATVYCFN